MPNEPKCQSCGHEKINKFGLLAVLFFIVGSIACFVGSGIVIGQSSDKHTWAYVGVIWFGASMMLIMGLYFFLTKDGMDG